MKTSQFIVLTFSLLNFYSANIISPKSTGCVNNFCSGNGNCETHLGTGDPSCTCLIGYTGDNCEIGPCELLDPCSVSSGRGDCAVINQEPVCSCHVPWSGNDCQTCDCGTHGTCNVQTFDGVTGANCVCEEGYQGLVCESLSSTVATANATTIGTSTVVAPVTTTVTTMSSSSSLSLVAGKIILSMASGNWLMMN